MLSLGEKIKILLAEKDITLQKLAETAGLDINIIYNLIYNRSKKSEYLVKVSRVLNVTPEYLLGKKPDTPFDQIDLNLSMQIMAVIHNVAKKYKLSSMPYTIFQDIYNSLYEEAINNQSESHLSSFALGMIKSKIDAKLVLPSNHHD
jgi:transcriptional regulator with XRE-family HTH domain